MAADSNKKSTSLPRFRLGQFMLAITVICILIAFLARPLLQSYNNSSHRKWMRVSPFTKVEVDDATVVVEFNDQSYQLISINGATAEQLLAAAERNFGDAFGDKRFIEDLPAVLGTMGEIDIDTETVALVLQDSTGQQIAIPDAPMTASNRSEVYRNSRKLTPGVPVDSGLTWTLITIGAIFYLCYMAWDFRRLVESSRTQHK